MRVAVLGERHAKMLPVEVGDPIAKPPVTKVIVVAMAMIFTVFCTLDPNVSSRLVLILSKIVS